jgi:chromosome segregation ATPase
MNELTKKIQQIKQQIEQNNTGLTSEDNRLQDLSQRCQNISHSLTKIDNTFEQLKKLSTGIEVAPEDLQKSLRQLNLPEMNGQNLKNKLEQIFQLASDNNQELTDKIKETETELEQILISLQNQQTLITNYQDQITVLETKIKSNENQAKGLEAKSVIIGIGVGGGTASLILILAKFYRKFKPRNTN